MASSRSTDGRDRPPEALAALIDAERAAPGPAPETRARLEGRIAASLAVGAPLVAGSTAAAAAGSVAATGSAAGSTAAGGVSALTKVVVAVGAVGAVGGGTAVVLRSDPAPAPRIETSAPAREPAPRPHRAPRAVAPTPTPPIDLQPVPDLDPEVAPAPPPRRTVPVPDGPETVPAPAASAPPPGLLEERTLLMRGRRALRRGDASGALAAAVEHERRFPHGALAEERDILSILALASGGQPGAARARAEAFAEAHPKSPYLPRIQHLLDSETKPAPPGQ